MKIFIEGRPIYKTSFYEMVKKIIKYCIRIKKFKRLYKLRMLEMNFMAITAAFHFLFICTYPISRRRAIKFQTNL